jgi:hypothetical protein
MVAGITLSVIGATLMGGGGIIASFGFNESGVNVLSGSLAFGGLGMVIAGVPLWWVGAERVPVDPWEAFALRQLPPYAVASSEEERAPRSGQAKPLVPPAPAPLRPEILVGPTSVAMRLSF